MGTSILQKNAELLLEKIEEADAICIGATAGMSAASGHHYHYRSDHIFKENFSEFEKKYGFQGTFNGFYYPFRTSEERWALIAATLHLQFHLPPGQTYIDLYELVKDRNYFIVTTNQDMQFHHHFPEERVSTIQGDNLYFQCKQPCHDALYESREITERMYANIHDCKIPSDMIPRCPKCGGELEPWVRGYTFLEGEKYKEQYRKWQDFIDENLQKKVLFLELGVGRMTPMFIRHPFWNLVYKMPQAYYIAINPKDAEMPGELEGKGNVFHEDIAIMLRETLAVKAGKKAEKEAKQYG